MNTKIQLLLLCIGATIAAANPLNFREYQQEFQLHFNTPQEAQAAVVKTRPLPKNYVLACSSRWDDSTTGHLRTHQVMTKHNMPGTFFLTHLGGALKQDADFMKKLLQGGCSVGLHTTNHPQLPCLDSYAHFQEYMGNRIELETAGQTPTNAQALPFCFFYSDCPMVPASIGWAMRATGVITTPDVRYPILGDMLGYPENAMAMSNFFSPGDRDPDMDKMQRWLDKILKEYPQMAKHPSITLGIHSWHTADGIKKLDQCFAMLAGRDNWWYCNQNDYGAYRYEALNSKVKTTVKGNIQFVTVSRMEPFELGANVPLWLGVENATPQKVTGASARLENGAVELPHTTGHALPTLYGRMRPDGTPDPRLPYAKLILTRDGLAFQAKLENLDKEFPLEKVAFTFRFPSAFACEALRQDCAIIPAGKNTVATVRQPDRKDDLYYRYGKPYYALQADFVRNGQHCRLYATLEEPQAPNLPTLPNQAVKFFAMPENGDLAQLSQPGAIIPNLQPIEGVSPDHKAGPGVIYPRYASWPLRDKARKLPTLMMLEMRSLDGKAKDVILTNSIDPRQGELWLNGQKIQVSKKMTLPLKAGTNRVAIRLPGVKEIFFYIDDEKTQSVEFLPIK